MARLSNPRGLHPVYHVDVADEWNETLALSRIRLAFEYVELRRDQDEHPGDSPAELAAIHSMRQAFEARDMQALKRATRCHMRDAPRDEE